MLLLSFLRRDVVGYSGLIWNVFWKFVEPHVFTFFSFNTSHVSRIFRQRVDQAELK